MTNKVLKLSIAMILLLSSVFCLSGCQKRAGDASEQEVSKEVYEKPIITRLEGIKSKSLEQVLQVYPEFMHMEKLITQENIEEQYNVYGTLNYALSDATKVDEDGIRKLENQLKALYADAGEIKIDKAFIITVKFTKPVSETPKEGEANSAQETQPSGDNSQTETNANEADKGLSKDFYSYSYNGNWYLY